MEYVELDAERAKQIVETKLQEKDVKGAIIFAKRVQGLFPELQRLFQFLGNLVVHVSSEGEEIDWYTVLGVNPFADSKTLKQCYVKFAKNRLDSFEAYKILDKAWGILSNKFEREAYDLRRRSRAMQQNAFIVGQATSANENVSKAFSNIDSAILSDQKRSRNNCNTGARDQRSDFATIEDLGPQLISPYPSSQAIYAPRPSDIIWSNKINIQPAMHNVSEDCGSGINLPPSAAIEVPRRPQVFCPHPNFHARYAPCPSNTIRSEKMNNQPDTYNVSGGCGSGQTLVSSSATVPNPKVSTPCRNSQPKYAPGPPNSFWSSKMNIQPGMHNVSGEHGSQTVILSGKELIKPSHVISKRGYEGGDQTSAARGKVPCIYFKESDIGSPSVGRSIGNKGVKHKKRKSSVDTIHDTRKNVPWSDMMASSGVDSQKDVYQRQTGNYPGEKISVSGSCKGNSREKLPDMETTSLLVGKARSEILNKMNEWSAAAKKKNECNAMHIIENATAKYSGQDGLMTMEVPDSDFHEFDKIRTQSSFSENQVWAVYDDDDGMPRLYALIHKVLSKRPFKLQISWLNSKSNKELGPLNWIDSGFHKTCGGFWVGKKQINNKLNSFSHKVSGWTKSARVYQIFPKKGDVWALYRNWSPNWNEQTTKEEKHKYDMVEVLEDYNEEKGAMIVPLVKVAGFKSVFHQALDAKEVRTIPKEEIFRFSHQVMSYLLTDQEAPTVPKGSKELDPAAMPLELLQVIN